MSAQTIDSFSAFASLNRFFSLIETTKPTIQQADEAAALLCRIYGANNEEELLQRGDPELIEIYNEIKNKILKAAI
ncbi:hypothetical protein [Paenibacillus sp. Soil787]|uniref:hypothetical protein n=1 Tax=Paenibacillus sp. Soil787 TaxID=1736411 RepID=UPI00070284FB|nr:hypothetical protein [Paenibacillus sp. Soil787]KRF21492.1 hypothetical protein ASG93_08965 [Paenibacillus sp. Soil787]